MLNETKARELMVGLIKDVEHNYTRAEAYRSYIQMCRKFSIVPEADFEEKCKGTTDRGIVKERIGQKFAPLYDAALEGLDEQSAQAILDRVREIFEADSD